MSATEHDRPTSPLPAGGGWGGTSRTINTRRSTPSSLRRHARRHRTCFSEHSTDPGADPGDLRLLSLVGERRSQPLVQTRFLEVNAELSLDGHWLAYQSNESGRDEIYVRPFPNVTGGKWQVYASGGARPLWGRNGQELVYESIGALMRVPLTTVPTFLAGTPSKLFDGPYVYGALERTYDVSPDGRRFLMIKESGGPVESAASARLILVPHWFEELKRLMPTK